MSLSACFILLEGVNVLDNIYDTEQLSVIRGSSALYKKAIDDIEHKFSAEASHIDGELQPISTGASSGLFRIVRGNSACLIKAINAELFKKDSNFHHLTFKLASCEAKSLTEARSALWTQLRLAQLQDFTTLPDGYTDPQVLGEGVCELEGRRIVSQYHRSKVGDEEKRLSSSVYARLIYGRDQRASFYEKELSNHPLTASRLKDSQCKFAEDFKQLCTDEAKHYPKLNNKMAVIYIDGNQFGQRQNEFIKHNIEHNKSDLSVLEKEIKAQRDFDDTIRSRRAEFLAGEISAQLDNLEKGNASSGSVKVIPLETLMWGGDEMLLVMPAWQGFDFLQRFFAFDWTLGESDQLKPLTHAVGAVFCQANTPIRVIQKLAYELAESVKDNYGRDKNGWDYLVLESVDYPTNSDLSDYFTHRYSKALADVRNAGLPPVQYWQKHQKKNRELIAKFSHLSKRQLYQVVGEMLRAKSQESEPDKINQATWAVVMDLEQSIEPYNQQICAERRMYQVSETNDKTWLRDELPALAESVFVGDMDDTTERAWLWLHLLELWDYLLLEGSE